MCLTPPVYPLLPSPPGSAAPSTGNPRSASLSVCLLIKGHKPLPGRLASFFPPFDNLPNAHRLISWAYRLISWALASHVSLKETSAGGRCEHSCAAARSPQSGIFRIVPTRAVYIAIYELCSACPLGRRCLSSRNAQTNQNNRAWRPAVWLQLGTSHEGWRCGCKEGKEGETCPTQQVQWAQQVQHPPTQGIEVYCQCDHHYHHQQEAHDVNLCAFSQCNEVLAVAWSLP